MQSIHLENHIEHYINLRNLTSSRLAIGYSGGVDSTALLICLMSLYNQGKLAFRPIAIYVRHGLRPLQETQKEEELLIRNSLKVSIPLIILDGNIEDRGSFTSETDARTYRFGLIQDLLDENRFETILTAHHQDDDLEFQLLRIAQGNGWKSFLGISDERPHVAKPFLKIPKKVLENYVQDHGFAISIDSSNSSNKIQRNVIRNSILPLWNQSNPQLLTGFENSKAKTLLLENFISDQLNQFSWNIGFHQVCTLLPKDEIHPYVLYELILQGIRKLSETKHFITKLDKSYNVFEPYGTSRESRRSRISLEFLKPIINSSTNKKIQGYGLEIEKNSNELTIKSYLAYSSEYRYSFTIDSDTCISTHHGTYIGYKLLTKEVLTRGQTSKELIEIWLPLNLVRCSSYNRIKKQEPNENKMSIFIYKGNCIGYLCKNNQGVVKFTPTKHYDLLHDEKKLFGFIPFMYGDEK